MWGKVQKWKNVAQEEYATVEKGKNGVPGALSVLALVLALAESGRELEHVKGNEANALVLLLTQNCVEDQNVLCRNLLGMAACLQCWLEAGSEIGSQMLQLSMEEGSLVQLHPSQFG